VYSDVFSMIMVMPLGCPKTLLDLSLIELPPLLKELFNLILILLGTLTYSVSEKYPLTVAEKGPPYSSV
jgi:hypothetical protein